MLTTIYALYVLIFLMNILFYFFIAYHLIAYSINARTSRIVVIFFSLVSFGLIISNFLLFSSVDWKLLLASTFSNNFNPF